MKEKKTATLIAFLVLLAVTAIAQNTATIPEGAEIKVRTDTAIPAEPSANTTFTAKISRDVIGQEGQVVIPQGAQAKLTAVPTDDNKDTVLDLTSVTMGEHTYLLKTQTDTKNSAPGGLGANKRTGKYVGGGALIGGVLGALLGGGKGAAIGAILGGAGGAGAQVYTGKKKEVPPETELSFKLAQNLQLQQVSRAGQ